MAKNLRKKLVIQVKMVNREKTLMIETNSKEYKLTVVNLCKAFATE